MDSNQMGDGMGQWVGGKGEGFSETTLKDTWTKPRGSGIREGRWGWLLNFAFFTGSFTC